MKHVMIAAILGVFALSGCSAEQRREMEQSKLDGFELSDKEGAIADALILGYKVETGSSLLRSQDYARAACYAKTVKLSSSYERAHLAYLASYPEADLNYYVFMKQQGLSENAADKVSGAFHDAYEACNSLRR